MNTARWVFCTAVLLGLLPAGGRPSAAQEVALRREQIVERLAPFGFWVPIPDHGLVWRPSKTDVGNDFTPFVTGGRWVTTATKKTTFVSRWSWGKVVFETGSWTADPRWGWLWIPPDVDQNEQTDDQADDDKAALPSLLPAMKIRSIPYAEGTDFAYPLGREWGRRLPAGTEIRYPLGAVGSGPGESKLVMEEWLHQPVFRYQRLKP